MTRYFTKDLLVQAAAKADKWDFNRQLDLKKIRQLPSLNYPVVDCLIHYHRRLVPCETHMRCVVLIDPRRREDGRYAIVDVPMEFFEKLPQIKRNNAA